MRRFRLPLLLLALAAPAGAVTLPPGFVAEPLPYTFDMPTCIRFLPDGRMLVAEKGGIVYLVNGSTRTTLWVRENEVLNTDDRGLLSIAVDPDFAVNRRLYFLYTCDPDSNGIETDHDDDAFGRLTRYEMSAANPSAINYGSRAILQGINWRAGYLSASGTHNVGDLAWGADGSLFVGIGDGAHYEQMDAGGLDPGAFGPGKTNPAEDIGAFRSQMLPSLNGKVLRVNPATGDGYPSNPFFDGHPSSGTSKVWAYGLRNPFRLARRPETGQSDPNLGSPGTLIIGDVGWRTWEEVNTAPIGGLNFGWPCFEGNDLQPEYGALSGPVSCEQFSIAAASVPIDPYISANHLDASQSSPVGFRGGVMVGGVFYTGTSYPDLYRGRYFFGDYLRGSISTMALDAQDRMVDVDHFATDVEYPVAFAQHPVTGDLYYVTIYDGTVWRLRYAPTTDVANIPRPSRLVLSAARPNPTRGPVSFAIQLAEPADVSFEVFDATGRRMWSQSSQRLDAGAHGIAWAGVTDRGERVSPGVYLARCVSGPDVATRRFVVLE